MSTHRCFQIDGNDAVDLFKIIAEDSNHYVSQVQREVIHSYSFQTYILKNLSKIEQVG